MPGGDCDVLSPAEPLWLACSLAEEQDAGFWVGFVGWQLGFFGVEGGFFGVGAKQPCRTLIVPQAACSFLGLSGAEPSQYPLSHTGLWLHGATWLLSPKLSSSSAPSPVPAGPGEEDCTPCTPEAPALLWHCVLACREGFYPADSHGLPNKVCKRYGTTPIATGAKPGWMGTAGSDDKNNDNAENSSQLEVFTREIKIGRGEPGQLWGWTPHAPAL